ncbi:MAG: class I SAM-dependent methyltransferase [Pseudomonadota bacterium]
MRELSKSIMRRVREPNFVTSYFKGNGLDIGGRPDPLSLYSEFFPLMGDVRIWDLDDGDAQFMSGVADNSFDFVSSSHCLEHLHDPREGLENWIRVTKPGGHVVVLIPDEDLYEQGVFPSTFNLDHKVSFTIYKQTSWSDASINVFELLMGFGNAIQVQKVELMTASYRRNLPRYDQTSTPIGESAIEFVIRKATPQEIADKGRLPVAGQPAPDLRIHYNQYRDDYKQMKTMNTDHTPFKNDRDL